MGALHARSQFVAEQEILREILGEFLYSADGFFPGKIFQDIPVKSLPYCRVVDGPRVFTEIPEYPRLDNRDPADHDSAYVGKKVTVGRKGIRPVDVAAGDHGQGRLPAYPFEKLPPGPVLELFIEIARVHENRVNANIFEQFHAVTKRSLPLFIVVAYPAFYCKHAVPTAARGF